MKQICENCKHFNNSGYKEHPQTQHIGFCSRWTETTPRLDSCSTFICSDEKEKHFRNLAKMENLKIQLNNQLEIKF